MLSFGNSWPSSSSCRDCGQADSAVTPTVIVALFDSEGIALVLNLSTSMHDSIGVGTGGARGAIAPPTL